MTELDLKLQELKRAFEDLKEENKRIKFSNTMLEKELQEYRQLEEQGLLRKVEQGEWIKQTRCIDTWSCTNCGEVEKVPTCMGEPIYNFCPNCGAKMKVVE